MKDFDQAFDELKLGVVKELKIKEIVTWLAKVLKQLNLKG